MNKFRKLGFMEYNGSLKINNALVLVAAISAAFVMMLRRFLSMEEHARDRALGFDRAGARHCTILNIASPVRLVPLWLPRL